ncbi:MAG: SixA phosphatase family protein [Cyclobacteriaceae bacterium]
MKKLLILVRHAKTKPAENGQKDFDRELMAEGVKDVSLIGRHFFKKNLEVDKIIASPAQRAANTAQLLAEQMRFDLSSIVYDETIYDASVRNLLNVINGISPDCQTAMLVGHNPAISYIAEYLSGNDVDDIVSAGVVIIEFARLEWSEISQGSGKLIETVLPDEIRAIYK